MILSDITLREYGDKLIQPFEAKQVKETKTGKVISYGCSSYGYDIRLAKDCRLAMPDTVLDPHGASTGCFGLMKIQVNEKGQKYVSVPPHGFVLAHSYEHIDMPDDVLCICQGKSTYARSGIVVNVTPLEPGWSGYITLELSNTTDAWVPLYVEEGIAQLLFFRGDRPCETTYRDRKGKYQDQPAEPVTSKV